MNSPPTTTPSPSHRPTLFDFCCILLGFTFSLILSGWSGLRASATPATPDAVATHLLPFLPALLFLPVGVLLFWPLFYLTQWLRGRGEPLSSGEWLWGVAWLGVLPLTAWVAWQNFGTLPEAVESSTLKHGIFVGYAVGTLALAVMALIVTLVGLVARWRPPWTHSCCLALLMWPVLPLAALFLWDIKLQ
jgi:hypothetical protein